MRTPYRSVKGTYSSSSGRVSDEPYSELWDGVTDVAPSKNSVYDKIESIDTTIESIIIDGAASDHLEQAALVGELYNLENKMFIQETPTYTNSTGIQNVGQNVANTEVHIQRIGSGTSSQELSLKVKMVGESSVNLVVEVREGVSQTKSETEARRYGNPDKVIATGVIPYSQIGTSWTECTVQLDNSIGGDRGQLLDVVIYQAGKVINTTNYYQIAVDESQYTEAYRIITYDGSAYTETTNPGYCVSEAFANRLLCKVGETEETTMTATTISGSTGWADNYRVNTPSINFTITDTTGVSGMGKYIVYIDCKSTNHTSCFLEGAKVTMADGTIKNVEDVKVGDMVMSYNVKTGEQEASKVTHVFVHLGVVNKINKLESKNRTLDLAAIHPVYAMKKGEELPKYIPANQLNGGDKILMDDGRFIEINRSEYDFTGTLYNLAVEGNHSCYVEGFLTAFE